MALDLGRTVATPGALKLLEEAGISPASLLLRHANGDWGTLSPHDRQANVDALRDSSRVFSVYPLPDGGKVWVITEAVGEDGNRESTCILLPSDY